MPKREQKGCHIKMPIIKKQKKQDSLKTPIAEQEAAINYAKTFADQCGPCIHLLSVHQRSVVTRLTSGSDSSVLLTSADALAESLTMAVSIDGISTLIAAAAIKRELSSTFSLAGIEGRRKEAALADGTGGLLPSCHAPSYSAMLTPTHCTRTNSFRWSLRVLRTGIRTHEPS